MNDDPILMTVIFLGNNVRVCRVFGGPELYVVTNGKEVIDEFSDIYDATECASEFVQAMSALRRRR